MTSPRQGEIWYVNLEPTVGVEIKKARPVVVISSDAINSPKWKMRIVVPCSAWQERFRDKLFKVQIPASEETGLKKDSVAIILQVRSISIDRFQDRLGQVSADTLQELLAGLVLGVDYQDCKKVDYTIEAGD
jgi:mRNA interferase MazF